MIYLFKLLSIKLKLKLFPRKLRSLDQQQTRFITIYIYMPHLKNQHESK